MTMKFAEQEVRQIAEETWKIILGEELEPTMKRITPGEIEDSMAACAQITGDWQLAVVLYCSSSLARHVATVMFGSDEMETSAADVNDAMCEMINVIAGNVKGVLSGSSHLTLPNLVKGQDFKLMFPRHVLMSCPAKRTLPARANRCWLSS
ncbi:MAG: chemotaxis protein CheX [Deltaproteobacteria bacterium]|nr:chemotaxis protein CheX [Deltaproteobacteria bacterium]